MCNYLGDDSVGMVDLCGVVEVSAYDAEVAREMMMMMRLKEDIEACSPLKSIRTFHCEHQLPWI